MKNQVAALIFLGSVMLVRADQMIESVQQALKDQGFYYGEITGETNANLTAAIRRYQIRNGLQVNGEFNSETIRSLGIYSAAFAHPPARSGNACRAPVVAAATPTALQSVAATYASSAIPARAWRVDSPIAQESSVDPIFDAITTLRCRNASTVVRRKLCPQKLALRCEAEFGRHHPRPRSWRDEISGAAPVRNACRSG